MASADIFATLGVKPILGRTFGADEDRKGGAAVVVLTSNFWKTRFGGDPHVLGRPLTLNDQLYTVIGVVPSDGVIGGARRLLFPSAGGPSRCSGTAAWAWACASSGDSHVPLAAAGPERT
jgi:hypothetical protein